MAYSVENITRLLQLIPELKKKSSLFVALRPMNRERQIYLLNIFLGIIISKYLGRELGSLWK